MPQIFTSLRFTTSAWAYALTCGLLAACSDGADVADSGSGSDSSQAGADGHGSGNGSGSSGNVIIGVDAPDDDTDNGNVCEKLSLDAVSTPPRVLIIQDLSSSMKGEWQALDDAMAGPGGIIESFGERMALGYLPFSSIYMDNAASIRAMSKTEFNNFFNANDDDCDISDASVIAPALGNSSAVTAAYDAIVEDRMVGGTPTNLAMTKARRILVDDAPGDGSSGYAILLTDGAPNCEKGESSKVLDNIEQLTAAGVETFVVGYNFSDSVLDTWAAAGTLLSADVTAPRAAYDASDTASLNAQIGGILDALVPCDYALSSEVQDPHFVRVTVDGADRQYDDADGWALSSDRKTILLQGDTCATLRQSGDHSLDVTVECKPVIVTK